MSRLADSYQERFERVLLPTAAKLEALILDHLEAEPRIDRIVARAKTVDRFLEKAARYDDPINEIQDQIGARIITFFKADVDRIAESIQRYIQPIEKKELVPETEWEFGYFGLHYVAHLPNDVVDPGVDRDLVPKFFELQIKTLFQHAWAEANHDLGYKPAVDLTSDDKRSLAFTAAQAWGADRIFDDLFRASDQKRVLAN